MAAFGNAEAERAAGVEPKDLLIRKMAPHFSELLGDLARYSLLSGPTNVLIVAPVSNLRCLLEILRIGVPGCPVIEFPPGIATTRPWANCGYSTIQLTLDDNNVWSGYLAEHAVDAHLQVKTYAGDAMY